jgi:hypothetical protein
MGERLGHYSPEGQNKQPEANGEINETIEGIKGEINRIQENAAALRDEIDEKIRQAQEKKAKKAS